MRFSTSCRQALEAIRQVQDVSGGVPYGKAFVALAELLPGPAISHALADPSVWQPDMKRQIREAVVNNDERRLLERGALSGAASYDGVVREAEATADKEKAQTVTERHLAIALGQHVPILAQLGINAERLISVTTAREESQRPEEALRLAGLRSSVDTQATELQASSNSMNLSELLAMDERGGKVDWKRSILNKDDGALNSQEKSAVALVNGNPGDEVYLVFGVDNDKTVVGQVDHRLQPLSEDQVRQCQRRLDQRLQSVRPPVRLAWEDLRDGIRSVLVARMRGRRRGTGVRTVYGTYPYRSGEDTYDADPATIAGWVAEEDPGLRQLLEARSQDDRDMRDLLERLVRHQETERERQRDQLFPRLDIVGAALQADGIGTVMVRYVAGKEPAQVAEVWVLQVGALSNGRQSWISETTSPVTVAVKPSSMVSLQSSPFPEWSELRLQNNEWIGGILWRGLGDRQGRIATRWLGGKRTEELVNEWDY